MLSGSAFCRTCVCCRVSTRVVQTCAVTYHRPYTTNSCPTAPPGSARGHICSVARPRAFLERPACTHRGQAVRQNKQTRQIFVEITCLTRRFYVFPLRDLLVACGFLRNGPLYGKKRRTRPRSTHDPRCAASRRAGCWPPGTRAPSSNSIWLRASAVARYRWIVHEQKQTPLMPFVWRRARCTPLTHPASPARA